MYRRNLVKKIKGEEEEGKRHYVLVKDLDTFMYDDTLDHWRKNFCCYCLQAFSTKAILKRHIKVCFKFNGKKIIKMPKKGEYVKFKNFKRKIKSPFMIYADFGKVFLKVF